jgi:hypothetical protein
MYKIQDLNENNIVQKILFSLSRINRSSCVIITVFKKSNSVIGSGTRLINLKL